MDELLADIVNVLVTVVEACGAAVLITGFGLEFQLASDVLRTAVVGAGLRAGGRAWTVPGRIRGTSQENSAL